MAHVEGMEGHVQSDGGLSNQRVRKPDPGRRTSEGEVGQHSVEIARSGPDDSVRSQELQQSFCLAAIATALQEFQRRETRQEHLCVSQRLEPCNRRLIAPKQVDQNIGVNEDHSERGRRLDRRSRS